MPLALTDSESLTFAVLGFGAIALLIIGVAQWKMSRMFSANFVKLFGLIFIATLAAAVVFPNLDNDVRTGVYTILGTIAGYLAGSRATAAPPSPPSPGSQGGSPPAAEELSI